MKSDVVIRPELAARLLNQIQGRKILVVGDVGVDQYTFGKVERISPEAPIPIVEVEEEKWKLGLAGNVVDNVAAFGAIPYCLGVVGVDQAAERLRALFEELHQRAPLGTIHLEKEEGRRTIFKQRLVSHQQQLLRVDYESRHPIHAETEKRLRQRLEECLPEVEAVILEDYAKGMMTRSFIQELIQLAKFFQKPVYVDPNRHTPLDFYQGAFLLTPNTQEAEALSGLPIRDEAEVVQAGRFLLEKTGAKMILVTRGKLGMALIFQEKEKTPLFFPSFAREVYDVSGAGDTVISLLALGLVSQFAIEHAVALANVAAGIKVGKRGTATVQPTEILEFLKHFF